MASPCLGHQTHKAVNLPGGGADNFGEETLLVREILVYSWFGHHGFGGDVVHAGAVVAFFEEQSRIRCHQHSALTFRSGFSARLHKIFSTFSLTDGRLYFTIPFSKTKLLGMEPK